MIENVTLYGGPKHGIEMAIPEGHDELKVDVIMTTAEHTTGVRSGHYTRVHNNSGHPSHDFEWAGYTSPFVPQQLG